MRIRAGFVSNSSSASFIIRWRTHVVENLNDPRLALIVLLDEDDREIDEISECTKLLSPGVFETTFYTIMMNYAADLGSLAGNFLLAFEVEFAHHGVSRFSVISKELEED